MQDELYSDEIQDYSESKRHRGRLDAPDYAADLNNPFCGDTIHLELKVDGEGRISHVRFDGHGCVISRAAASMLAERVEGLTLAQARGFSDRDALGLLGVRLTPTRVKCGLLGWRALQHAIPATVEG